MPAEDAWMTAGRMQGDWVWPRSRAVRLEAIAELEMAVFSRPKLLG